MTAIQIGSLNVWGLGDIHKRRQVFEWLRNKNQNIYFLQETKCTKEKEQLWVNEWGLGASSIVLIGRHRE